ncbi:hypothetical protein GCM10027018_14670 [Paenibacillus thermoaerophilus]
MRFAGVAAGPPAAAYLMKTYAPSLFWGMAGIGAAAAAIALFAIRPGSKARTAGSLQPQQG